MSMPDAGGTEMLDTQARELTVYLDELVRLLVATRRDSTAYESLTRHEFAVLDALGTHGPLLLREIAGRVHLGKAIVSLAGTQLTTRHLARRRVSPTDARDVTYELTTAGFKLYRALLESRSNIARKILVAFDRGERAHFLELLRRAFLPR